MIRPVERGRAVFEIKFAGLTLYRSDVYTLLEFLLISGRGRFRIRPALFRKLQIYVDGVLQVPPDDLEP